MAKQWTKEDLEGILYGDDLIYNKIVNSGRWSITREIVFKHEGKFFKTYYFVGSTEYQDEDPWEYGLEPVVEVFPVQKTITVYESNPIG